MSDVKGRPGQARRDRARATRVRILRHAYELFSEHGYPTATMESIAAAAGVATQTMYYIFGTKAQLLRQVIEVAAAGEHDPAPVMQRTWMVQALSEDNPRRSIALVVEYGVDIYARVAPLITAVRTAASLDADVETYWQQVAAGRRQGMAQFVATLAAHGNLHPGITAQRAADILFVVNSHETFLGLTRGCGWSIEEFKAWLYETLCQQLLPHRVRETSGLSKSPTHGLSFDHLLATGSQLP